MSTSMPSRQATTTLRTTRASQRLVSTLTGPRVEALTPAQYERVLAAAEAAAAAALTDGQPR